MYCKKVTHSRSIIAGNTVEWRPESGCSGSGVVPARSGAREPRGRLNGTGSDPGKRTALAVENQCTIDAIDTDELRKRLEEQHTQLFHPMSVDLHQHLMAE